MKIFIVTGVDIGETCDGKARVLKICRTLFDAKQYIKKDMEEYLKKSVEMELNVDYDKMSIYTKHYQFGCEWNVEEFDIPLPDNDCIKKTEQVLIDNGIEKDEASTVLQAIGYTLLDMELYP